MREVGAGRMLILGDRRKQPAFCNNDSIRPDDGTSLAWFNNKEIVENLSQ